MTNQENHTRTPEIIAAEIKAWDKQNVDHLRDLIRELNAYRDENGDEIDTQAYVDFTSLPSAKPVPENLASYPMWAIDEDGYCLVGDALDSVQALAEFDNEADV